MYLQKLERNSSVSSKESMEDILVKRYKDSIDKGNAKLKRKSSAEAMTQSPYSQNIAPENSSLFKKALRNRPMSAKASTRRRVNSLEADSRPSGDNFDSMSKEKNTSSGEENYSSAFDESSSEEPIPENKETKILKIKRARPASAQVRYEHENGSTNDNSMPIFKRHTFTITCNAFKNGSLDTSVRIAAPSIKQLLESATLKLSLNTAARRVFLGDGSEAFRSEDIARGVDVFISMGEAFRDPYRALKNSRGLTSSSLWSMQGVSLPPRHKNKPQKSKRLNELVGKRTLRVLVFSNGEGSKSHEVVFNDPVHYSKSQSGVERKPSPYENRKERRSSAEAIERKHAVSLNKFLDGCTQRLSLNTPAKFLFNWKGDVITHISQVEKIDAKVTEFVMFGPLWVSKREGFSPVGSKKYLEIVITDLRGRLHGAKQCKRDLELLENEQFDDISNPDILNLNEDHLQQTKDKVAEDIEEFKALLKKYKARWNKVKNMADKQMNEGASYTMKNIKEIEGGDRIVGEHGLRLRVYDNGSDTSTQEVYLNMRDIQRGAKDKDLVRSRFLEALTSWHKPTDPTGPARSSVVRRIFDEDGKEIFDVFKIENESDVWLSYGEDFKPLYKPVLTLQMEKVAAVVEVEGDKEGCKVYLETLDVENLPKNSERPTQWDTTEGFPSAYKCPVLSDLTLQAKYETEKSIKSGVFSSSDHYMQFKKDSYLVLRPSVKVDQKKDKTDFWPKESQTWMFNRKGKIYSRAFPSLSLAVDNTKPMVVHYKDGTTAQGFPMSIKKKSTCGEEWCFSPEGNIYAKHGMPQHVLTYLDPSLIQKIDDRNAKGDESETTISQLTPATQFDSLKPAVTIAVMKKFKDRNLKSNTQRWAIKQESLSNPCQWKKTKVANPEWRKLAYSWPVLPNGNWNEEYKWPMEGTLLPNAPSLANCRTDPEKAILRLRVFKNGEKNDERFVYIVAPDLTNMEKDSKKMKKQNNAQHLTELEMTLFLEKATSLLALGFAARRLFDENGKEVSSLKSLKRNQAVYVSMGEAWIDPRVSKIEQKRRHLLAKLTHDVSMIRAYCDLKNPKEMVLETERGLHCGSRLVLRKCSISKEEREAFVKGENNQVPEKEDKASESGSEESYPFAGDLSHRSSHEQSHLNSDKKFQLKKYSWQQEKTEEDENEEKEFSTRRRKKDKNLKKGNPNQMFTFSDGFISPVCDPSLVFGVTGVDLDNLSGNVEIVLCRKSVDDPVQQWNLTEDGFIRLQCSKRLVLGVSMPNNKPGQNETLSYENAPVTIQTLKPHTFGRANQKWLFDPVFNTIQPFQSDLLDKEITAANHASVCTSAVAGSKTLCQDGYMIDIPSFDDDHPVAVCCSCAKVIRGQYPLFKVPEEMAFVCALGNASKSGIRQKGSFAYLNGKVDLSTCEADTSLQYWTSELQKMRQETSLRFLKHKIQSTTPIQACRVLAMRNGEGRLRDGELIIGTSISGILDQCTQRLSLGTAARRLYTCDGKHILHMEQLIEWATENYHAMQKDQIRLFLNKNDYERGEPEGNTIALDNHKREKESNAMEGTPNHHDTEAGIKAADLGKKVRPPSGRPTSPSNKGDHTQQQSLSEEVPLSVILRNPIEVWVSCGENFILPATAETLYDASLKAQIHRNDSNLVIDTEKHTLRHMQGRRFKEMSPRSLKATKTPRNPILVEGGWLETTKDEAVKLEKVNKLEEHLSETRPYHPPARTKGINLNRELYRQADRKRVMIYLNGESFQKAVYVWGESIKEILADATIRLNMHRKAKVLYNEEGVKVTSFELIERDSLLCVTGGDSLKGRPKQSNVAMKANWARVRKQRGPEATEITVTKKLSEPVLTGVDPFGPPLLSEGSLALEAP